MFYYTATKHRHLATVMENKIWGQKLRMSFSEMPEGLQQLFTASDA